MEKQNTIVIIGLGFVGLTFATFLATKNCKVIGIDKDKNKINLIQQGISPIFEPGLEKSLKLALKKSFNLHSSLKHSIKADFVFVTVGTPSKSDGSINLQYIKAASKELAAWLKKTSNFPVIAYKSTIVPGTLENTIKPILNHSNKKEGKDFGLVANPEFLREGTAVHDTANPHVVVIGGNKRSTDKIEKFYRQIYSKKIPIKITNSTSAEFIKYVNNSFLATRIVISLVLPIFTGFPLISLLVRHFIIPLTVSEI